MQEIAKVTLHNKYGLAAPYANPDGITTDRSQVLPYSLMMYDEENGWEQYGVYRTVEEAERAMGVLSTMHTCPLGLCDTHWFLDCEDEIIRELPNGKLDKLD